MSEQPTGDGTTDDTALAAHIAAAKAKETPEQQVAAFEKLVRRVAKEVARLKHEDAASQKMLTTARALKDADDATIRKLRAELDEARGVAT